MDKPIDDLKSNTMADWRRGMLARTITGRFPVTIETLEYSNTHKVTIGGLSQCPSCDGAMFAKKVTLQDGNVMFVPQCINKPDDKDHGFGKWSIHGNRGPMGRPAGAKNKKKEKAKEEIKISIDESSHKVEPVKEIKVEVAVTGRVIHPEVIRASKYVIAGERNIYFTGPAGTGKSTGAEHMFEILMTQPAWKEAAMYMTTVSLGTFVSDLAGFLDRLNKGEFVATELVKALQVAGVVVVEEADKGNPNLAGFWNVILANGQVNTPGGTFKRHQDNVVVFIGNTTGHQPSKQYSGSVRQDFATLDRFRCFNVGFNEKVEKAAVPGVNEDLFRKIQEIRAQASKTGLQRIIGTRWMKRANQTMQVEGIKDAVKAIKTVMQDESWSNDEILAAGI